MALLIVLGSAIAAPAATLVLQPNGDTATRQHASTEATAWEAVDDVVADGDVTFIYDPVGSAISWVEVGDATIALGIVESIRCTMLFRADRLLPENARAWGRAGVALKNNLTGQFTPVWGAKRDVQPGPAGAYEGASVTISNRYDGTPLRPEDVIDGRCGVETFGDPDTSFFPWTPELRVTQIAMEVTYSLAPSGCSLSIPDSGDGTGTGRCEFAYRLGDILKVAAHGDAEAGSASVMARAGDLTFASCTNLQGGSCVAEAPLSASWQGVTTCYGEGLAGMQVECRGEPPGGLPKGCRASASDLEGCSFRCDAEKRIFVQLEGDASAGSGVSTISVAGACPAASPRAACSIEAESCWGGERCACAEASADESSQTTLGSCIVSRICEGNSNSNCSGGLASAICWSGD